MEEHKDIEKALHNSELSLRTLFDSMDSAIFIHDPKDGIILDVNKKAEEMFLCPVENIKGKTVDFFSADYSPYSAKEAINYLQKTLQGEPQTFEWVSKRCDGSEFWSEVRLKLIDLDSTKRVLAIVRDITQQKESEKQLQLSDQVFKNTIEGILVTDPEGVILHVNPAFYEITGYTREEVIGNKPNILKSNRHGKAFYEMMWKSLLEKGYWRGEIWNRRKSGEIYPEWLTITAIKDASGRTTHYVSIFHDITENKRNQEKIHYQAHHDALTDLPNRTLFQDRLSWALFQAKRNEDLVGVMFLDLDNFKRINDSLGHNVGDILLQKVAQRLLMCVRDEDTVARLGGDEFVLILMRTTERGVIQVARRLLGSISEPFFIKDHDLQINASIGITLYPNDGSEPTTLLKNADLAMYRAKDMGRNNYQLFTPSMNEKANRRLEMENDMRFALKHDEFVIYYQPRIHLRSGKINGVEALVRWNKPNQGIVSPGAFIEIAEESGLIHPLGEWILRHACSQLKEWHDQGYDEINISVNLSVKQFQQKSLVKQIRTILHETGLEPQYLELEITESIMMQSIEKTVLLLIELADLGIKLSVDDFGTGYSSLYYLKHFPLKMLKIDRSFVEDITTDPQDAAIVETIIAMARALHLNVVAEGVETKEQLEFLIEKGCDELQGYLFCPPVPAEEIQTILREGKRFF